MTTTRAWRNLRRHSLQYAARMLQTRSVFLLLKDGPEPRPISGPENNLQIRI
jgi:hypothetical protein